MENNKMDSGLVAAVRLTEEERFEIRSCLEEVERKRRRGGSWSLLLTNPKKNPR